MSEKKHILVVCQYFYPEQFRINDICIEWVKRGYKVTVLTGIPNYPQGKFYEGYGYNIRRNEVWNDVEIIRIPLIPRGHTPIGMVLNYFSFMLSGKRWVRKTKLKADLVFNFETSPMTQSMIPVWYKKRFDVPFFIYVQDLWPENVEIVTGIKTSIIINSINRMVDKIYKAADEIFATSPSFVDAICDRKVAVDRKKVHYWPQYAEDFYKPIDREEAFNKSADLGICDDDSFKIAFTGNIGYAQGLDILPQVASLLREDNVKFIMVGDGRYLPKLMEQIEELGVTDKFLFTGRQPAERVPEILGCCGAAFISFMDNELFEKTIPAKLQSYMACGMPIIASAGGETKRVVEEAECGVVSGLGDAQALTLSVKSFLKKDVTCLKRNSVNYSSKNFDKKILMNYMCDILEEYND